VLNSYQGAQIFEAIGIGKEVVDFAFTGVQSKIGGIGFAEIAEESLIRHRAAFETEVPAGETLNLGDPGYNRYRKSGERHAWTTDVIKNFHTYVKSGKAEDYDEYVKVQLETTPVAIKDLFEFVPAASGPIPIEEVESQDSIRRRFTTAAMSLGALSPEAHETLAIAARTPCASSPTPTATTPAPRSSKSPPAASASRRTIWSMPTSSKSRWPRVPSPAKAASSPVRRSTH
jgi:glutamate synthase (NADPH/NADH) large chain/glutamate synthase (ferredoxin)